MKIDNLIKKYNYPVPNLREIDNNGASLEYNSDLKRWTLEVDDIQWMAYGETTHWEGLFQVFSHYYIARGDVITTGLGMGIREAWLLNNPDVTSVTCIEQDERVAEIALSIYPQLKDINIIIGDADHFSGHCDTLLLDHFEGSDFIGFANKCEKIIKKVNTKQSWFWTYEVYLMHMYMFQSPVRQRTLYQIYRDMMSYYKLPNLRESELNTIMQMYFQENKHIQRVLNSNKRFNLW